MYTINTLLCPVLFMMLLNSFFEDVEQPNKSLPSSKPHFIRLPNQKDRLKMIERSNDSFWQLLAASTDKYPDSIARFDKEHLHKAILLYQKRWHDTSQEDTHHLKQYLPGIEAIINGRANPQAQKQFSTLLSEKIKEAEELLQKYAQQYKDFSTINTKELPSSKELQNFSLGPLLQAQQNIQALLTLQQINTIQDKGRSKL